jgi:hypothetical protein
LRPYAVWVYHWLKPAYHRWFVNKTGANRFLGSTVIDLSPDPPLITPQVFASLAGFFIGAI